jgi:hypothetical protein
MAGILSLTEASSPEMEADIKQAKTDLPDKVISPAVVLVSV